MHQVIRAFFLSLCLLLLPHPAIAGIYVCQGQPVEVHALDDSALTDICSAAQEAFRFLARYDLHPKHTIRIHIVAHPLTTRGHPVYGSYNSRQDLIEVMSLEAILTGLPSPTMYEQPFDREHHLGVIAHEVAHAVVQHNSQVERMSNAAQEYLAHATQLAVLPADRRAEIISAAGVGAWEPNDVISDIYMALAINRFAVKCYLHLTETREPLAFVQALLTRQWRYVTVM